MESVGDSNVVDIADDVVFGDILDWGVRGRASNVKASSITLIHTVEPKAVDTGVGLGNTEETSNDREESCAVDHFDVSLGGTIV